MSNKTVLNIKTDKSLKDEARKVADTMGLPLSTVINNYLRTFVQERKIQFQAPYTISPKLEKIIKEVEQDEKKGKNFSGPFRTKKEVQTYLDSIKR